MATATGAYATLAPLKQRLTTSGNVSFGTQDDPLLQSCCDQANDWIESKTGRILAPIPQINTTVASGGGAGSTAVTLASGAGIAAGDILMFGPASGTHEHQTVLSVSGAVITLQSPLVASYAAAQPVTRVLLFDGYDALEGGRLLPQPNGIVTMTNLEVGFFTGDAFKLIPTTDWFLRPKPLDREPGWPAFELWMTDFPSPSNAAPIFSAGLGNIRCSGIVTGWPAIPDAIADIALTYAAGIWRARNSGGGTFTLGTDGERTFEKALSTEQWRTINRYSSAKVEVLII